MRLCVLYCHGAVCECTVLTLMYRLATRVLYTCSFHFVAHLNGCEGTYKTCLDLRCLTFVRKACRYILVQARAEWVMKIWVPLIILSISLLCILIEARVGVQYYAEESGADWARASLRECARIQRIPPTPGNTG